MPENSKSVVDRYKKLNIPNDAVVRIVVSSYVNDDYRRFLGAKCLLYSLLCQTYENIEILLVHDGKINDEKMLKDLQNMSEKIKVIETPERKGNWGMYHRHFYATIEPFPSWVLFTNDDNYYAPKAIELLLDSAYRNNSKFVCCDMVHSHQNWSFFRTFPKVGMIDMGSFITEFNLIRNTPFKDFDFEADGKYAVALASQTTPVKVGSCLFVHN